MDFCIRIPTPFRISVYVDMITINVVFLPFESSKSKMTGLSLTKYFKVCSFRTLPYSGVKHFGSSNFLSEFLILNPIVKPKKKKKTTCEEIQL